ncbi:MAG TPA: uridine phosphorylase [Brevefilum sp.]
MNEEKMHHINMKKGDVGRYVLLPGDPGRSEIIAQAFDTYEFVTSNREYTTFTGTLSGEKVSVMSTGIGCPSTSIGIEELRLLGADTFIRVGTSGAMRTDMRIGVLAINTGAIRDEGTTIQYMPIEFPAIPDLQVTNALVQAAEILDQTYFTGITQSKDSFYGQHQPERMPVDKHLLERWKAWKMGGTICSEMEAAALFILGSIYKLRTGGVMLITGNQESGEQVEDRNWNMKGLVNTAVEALRILIESDKKG